jgi:hypothetical protein
MTSFAQQYQTGTNSDSMIQTESPCCQRENVPQPDVGAVRQLPHMGDDEAFADRLQRAWQKMLDDEMTFGSDWTSEIA